MNYLAATLSIIHREDESKINATRKEILLLPSSTATKISPPPKIAMTPEEYDRYLINKLKKAEDLLNELLVKKTIGKLFLGLMQPQSEYATAHDDISLLKGYAENGCSVDCGPD